MRFSNLATTLAIILCLVTPAAASAASTYWQVSSGDWSTGSNWDSGEPGSGDLAYINNEGTAQITQSGETCAWLYVGEGAAESGTVELSAGSLSVPSIGWEYIGMQGTGLFEHSGGTNSTHGLALGQQSSGIGIYALSGSGSLSSTVEAYVGLNGEGTFTQTGGTYAANGGLALGYNAGADGSYSLSGGSLSLPTDYWEIIGGQGAGTFTHSGGTNDTPGGIRLGDGSAGYGTYNLGGTGSLSVGTGAYVGVDGMGEFTQSGGTNTISTGLYLGYNSGSSATYMIYGGQLSVEDLHVGYGGSGTLDIADAGAQITVSSLLRFGADSNLTAVAGSTIHMTGSDLENVNTDEADLLGLTNLELIFEGGSGTTDDFEVACEDKGAVYGGYNYNFALGTLTVGGADVGDVRLVDGSDNGNRGGAGGSAEALYVESLVLNAGSVLDLNNLHLYWRKSFTNNGGTILNGNVAQATAPCCEPGICHDGVWGEQFCGRDAYLVTGSADMDHDCVVNDVDVALFEAEWGLVGPNLSADLNGDNIVNASDYFILRSTVGLVPSCVPCSGVRVPSLNGYMVGLLAMIMVVVVAAITRREAMSRASG